MSSDTKAYIDANEKRTSTKLDKLIDLHTKNGGDGGGGGGGGGNTTKSRKPKVKCTICSKLGFWGMRCKFSNDKLKCWSGTEYTGNECEQHVQDKLDLA